MLNMGYCRFANTLAALRECAESLVGADPLSDLSDEEREAAKQLFKLCREMADDYDI